ncbi:MAG: hypothetical protein RL095_180 [Verrucomicrobiota bacterium]|jgi:hypothetical protein
MKKYCQWAALLALMFLFTSCEWSRWMDFRDQMADGAYAKNARVEIVDRRGVIHLQNPILTAADIRLVTQKEPTLSVKENGLLRETWVCRREGPKRRGAADDMEFLMGYNAKGTIDLFKAPVQFATMFKSDLASYAKAAQCSFIGSVKVFSKGVESELPYEKGSTRIWPDKAMIIAAYGEADKDDKSVLTYNYYVSPAAGEKDDGKNPGRQIRMEFSFDKKNRLKLCKMFLGSTELSLELGED